MRDILKKTVAVTMVAGAALALAACKSETTNTVSENVSMTDTGTMNDTSAVDSNGSNAMMMGDNASNAM